MAFALQALKSGQLPADLKIPDYDSSSRDDEGKEEKMVPDNQKEAEAEPNNAETQKSDESAAMEQVSFYSLFGIQTELFVFLCLHSLFPPLCFCHEECNVHDGKSVTEQLVLDC